MKKLKSIFIISAFGAFFLSQKNSFSQDSISLNQVEADKNSAVGTYIIVQDDVLSNMLLLDIEETIITEQNNTSSDSVNVVTDFILSGEKDPDNN